MRSTSFHEAVQDAAALIRSARHGAVLSGAGISTPSGIPDFRSPDSGLWTQVDPWEVASLQAFRHNPERFYKWIRPLAGLIHSAQPNPAHQALVRLEKAGHIQNIITQNIDGLHQKAGAKSVIEVHGAIDTLTCVNCYQVIKTATILDKFLGGGEIPRCPKCSHILKPNVILMEEQLPIEAWQRAYDASMTCDLMLIAGSSLEVLPVAGLPMRAVERGVALIVVNYTKTYLNDRADVVINGDIAEVVPLIAEEVLRVER
jgi:NAD-dependent deacetylase